MTLLGLVATVSLMVATYNKGQVALPLVLRPAGRRPASSGTWPGWSRPTRSAPPGPRCSSSGGWPSSGPSAALLLSPALFPDRHGIAFLLGGVIAAVAYDVGALTFGAWLGRHPMASVSPNKTWEGFVGGLRHLGHPLGR